MEADIARIEQINALLQPFDQYLRAEIRESRGCCIVAAKNIPEDTVIVVESGIAICPESDYLKFVCDHCFNCPAEIDWLSGGPVMPIECRGCRTVRWCKSSCQENAQNGEHDQIECNIYNAIGWCKSAATQKRRRARQLARLILLRQHDPVAFQSVRLLCTNRPMWPEDQVGILEEVAQLTANCLPDHVVDWPLERDLMVDLLMAINCNQFALHNESEDAFATGVFVLSGLFNHSCDPTLRFDVEGHRMSLKTLRFVSAGEELCHSYLQTCEEELFKADSVKSRRELLRSGYFFDCTCSLCQEQLKQS